jgi:site-specific DNA recombinase
VIDFRRQVDPHNSLGDQQDLILDHATLTSLISHIEVKGAQLVITLKPIVEAAAPAIVSTSWQKPPFMRFREILLPHGTTRENIRPDRAERRARLVSAIARGRRWLDEIVSGSVIDAEQLAKRERCTVRQVNLTLSLAFLTPRLVKAAVEGRLPRGINIERLRDPDVLWSRQF